MGNMAIQNIILHDLPSILGLAIVILLAASMYYLIKLLHMISKGSLIIISTIFSLNPRSYIIFALLFLLNYVFLLGFLISFIIDNPIPDTLATLLYAIGIFIFLREFKIPNKPKYLKLY